MRKNFLQSMMPPASQRIPKEKSGEMSADQRSQTKQCREKMVSKPAEYVKNELMLDQ
jgi:hypothetical protein